MQKLPLFPLNTVLFPTTPIQLHVFELRYLRMIKTCVDKGLPFGVVLIRSGQEALGALAEPFEVGVTARITQVEPQENGTLNLLAMGVERFRIRQLDFTSQPYLQGDLDSYPVPLLDGNAAGQMRARLEILLDRYLHILAEAGAIQAPLQEYPAEPMALAYLSAAIVQIEPAAKQKILELDAGEAMLAGLVEVYRRETALLRSVMVKKTFPDLRGFTPN